METNNNSKAVAITTRAHPFACEGRGEYDFEVEPDGTIKVYDSVAGHFTGAHSLSTRDANRIRRLAARS